MTRCRTLIAALFVLLLPGCDEVAEAGLTRDDGLRIDAIELERLSDRMPEPLARYGGQTVVLNVWATWCPPCRAEMPALQRLADALEGEGVVVVGVSIDERPGRAREYLRRAGVRFANYHDGPQQVTRGMLSVDSIPETFIFGPDGRLRERISGAQEWDGAEVVEALRRIQGETANRGGRSDD